MNCITEEAKDVIQTIRKRLLQAYKHMLTIYHEKDEFGWIKTIRYQSPQKGCILRPYVLTNEYLQLQYLLGGRPDNETSIRLLQP
jgi:hypothetical protein